MFLLTAAEMAELDRRTIDVVGLPGVVLMENAGRGATRAIVARYGRRPFPVAVLCGPGNNGGDGFVIARVLASLGFRPRVALLGTQDRVQGDAAIHMRALLAAGGCLDEITDETALQGWGRSLDGCEVVIDAIFGTGLRSEVTGLARAAIEWIDRRQAQVVAVDVPSGVDASTGRVLGTAPVCALTVTFGFPKVGHVLPPGCELAGDVRVVDIGIPSALLARAEPKVRLLTALDVARVVPPRPRQAHKGTFGHLLVVGGSRGLSGAATLAAVAALRTGAGLVTLGTPAAIAADARPLEVMSAALPDGGRGVLGSDAFDSIERIAAGKQAIALGPGLGRSGETLALVRRLITEIALPMVVDADALVAITEDPAVLRAASAPRVLTPHPGEMGHLIGATPADVQADRLGVARRFAREHGCVVVLKGAGTVVAHPDGSASINSTGNPGMSTGGMGDVLTGIVGALLALRMPPGRAAELAVYLHGAAADRAACEVGRSGLLASEVAHQVPRARDDLELGRGGAIAPRIQWVDAA